VLLLLCNSSKMQFISFYILYGVIWLFTRLPIKILYSLTDIVFLLIYYVIPYRKKVVFKNLRNSFPEWDEKQVKKTARRFYRFFFDFFMESTIFLFMKEEDVHKRFKYKNPDLLNDLYARGKSVILVFGHYANWEWSVTLPRYINHKALGVYKPLHHKYFDRMFINSRQRFGLDAIPVDKIVRTLSECHKSRTLNISFFAADQRPLMKNIQYWTTFLKQDTPVVLGPEKLSKKLDSAIVFFKINRIKRGYYESEFSLITDDADNTKDYEITDKFLKLLEEQIAEEPALYLWTHDRWKHKKADYIKIYGKRGIEK
jgi:KDO2-lipid IV(A) lauroyltransferase